MQQGNIPLPLEDLLAQLRNYPGLEISIKGAPKQATTFSQWAQYWLRNWHLGRVKGNTYEGNYREPVEIHLIPYFGKMNMHEITPHIVQEFFNQKSSTSALESLKKYRACLKGIFDTAVENGICNASPLTPSIRMWSTLPEAVKTSWSQEQYDIAYAFARTHKSGVPIMILMETGISRSELLGLTWDDFDPQACAFHISNGLVEYKNPTNGTWAIVHDGLKNRYRNRWVPISQELAHRIATKPKYIMVKQNGTVCAVKTKYICHSPTGKAYSPHNWYIRQFVRFMEDLHEEHPDVPILTTHELRHTKATLLTYQGVDLYTVARLLGHRDLSMLSKRYLHDDLAAMRKALGLSAAE